MVLDFDIGEYCKKVRLEQSPPFKCPVVDCARSYKSICGLQYHLQNYDHDNPTPQTPAPGSASKNKKGRSRISIPVPLSPTREALTYDEAQKVVQFEIEGKIVRVNVADEIPVMTEEEMEMIANEPVPEIPPEPVLKLPEPAFKELDDYNICDAPSRPNAYIRFIEKSAEELDGEVEYDVDEEDTAWLSLMNEKREASGLTPVSVDTLELLMDRLEKESYFQAAQTGQQSGAVVDDDAVCCICMDGECQNTNVILFCDMCNLAVHQDCYGVPYIPEGQWLCRRCLQSPSRAVDCVLCPNHGGAFKQTDRGHWAHVVCALWIPEVRFANTVFLEPIDSIETIPPARWKLTCYVCKQRGVGACIQCHKTNCYAAFHVTCAQQAGLYMKMDTVKDSAGSVITGQSGGSVDTQPVLVQKIAYCDTHAPADGGDRERAKQDSRQRMKQARKILAKKRTSVPIILIPTIPPERIQEIGSLVTIAKKSQFIQRLIAYWTLKRQFRNGVPLLRRLQSGPRDGVTSSGITSSGARVDTLELYRQLKYWQCLRQDLERARLLCELVRKREKLKVEHTKARERCLAVQLRPLECSMRRLLDLIAAKDTHEIFIEPVDLNEVPDYTTVVTNPMDLSTMKEKLDAGLYDNLNVMQKDFDLMIANCLAYNGRDTLFYRSAIKMREAGSALFKQAKEEFQQAGFFDDDTIKPEQKEEPVTVTEEIIPKVEAEPDPEDLDREFETLKESKPTDIIEKLEELLVKVQNIQKKDVSRTKRIKAIKAEISKQKKKPTVTEVSSQSDGETEEKSSPQPSGTSPVGVNRRTAVLFTRKAQAALKKPESEQKSSESRNQRRRAGRPKRNTDSQHGSEDPKKNVPDSFRVYRAGSQTSGDEDSDSGSSLSTCYSVDLSDIESSGSDSSEQSQEEEGENEKDSSSTRQGETLELRPLQLVWAKCRGYPWYPALIIDPLMPKDYIHNGVPIPAPPQEVLALASNYAEPVFLVLFFDAKRTWQWLPADKLEILGLDVERDQAKVSEPRKPADRKAVRRAYQNALTHQKQVENATNQPVSTTAATTTTTTTKD